MDDILKGRMDDVLTATRRTITDLDASKSTPHVVGVSVVPPEHPVVDEPLAAVSVDPAPLQFPASPPPSASEQAQGAAPPTTGGRNTPAASDRGPNAGMLSPETSAAVGSAFNSLTQVVRKQNSQTLEDFVRETLHPRLASWLDDNLPGLVERMVRTEIERIAREH